ncbi:prepilin peptidase, partial [Glycocaulis albus]|uniref:prepilin peptidase n=1 Tax=Glycocaulis albus TaxID=1382801 RepID=UPI00357121D3
MKTGRTALGLGDAKLLAAGGAWCGWQMLPPIVTIASLGGLAFLTIRAVVERREFSRSTKTAFWPVSGWGYFCVVAASARGEGR